MHRRCVGRYSSAWRTERIPTVQNTRPNAGGHTTADPCPGIALRYSELILTTAIMAAPSFDLPRLKGLISQDDLPPETLLTILADHEATVCLLFNAEGVDRAGAPLLQLYYSAHLFALLLVDDLCV